ncbi:MAG: hypothetical protein ACYTGG_05070 [Planctomycetota bacterium]
MRLQGARRAEVELVLRGLLADGTRFEALDCEWLVPPVNRGGR